MVRRVFWFSVGAGATVLVAVKVRKYLKQARAQALGRRVSESAAGIGETVRDFTGRVRAAMAERELELREALGQPE
jgi:hypothetical protein